MRFTRMSRRDRRAWQSATTITDLGHLTARWLEGDIKSQAGYTPNCRPDEETTGLIPTLVAVNRAGYLTDQSQPGLDTPGHDGARWQQRAAVAGFITDHTLLQHVQHAATDAGLIVITHRPGTPEDHRAPGYAVVTLRASQPYTAFGARTDADTLNATWSAVSPAARHAITSATQITLIDPHYGRNDTLWPLLHQLAAHTRTGV